MGVGDAGVEGVFEGSPGAGKWVRCFRWTHFACHAMSNFVNPSASYLLLHDYQKHPLTVVDVARLRLDTELAFLSACATARTGARLPDEAIQLAAGFQLAGYRHVVATLWPIGDRLAVKVAKDIYTTIATGGVDKAAGAVHKTLRRRRNLDADRERAHRSSTPRALYP
ncbi:MAG: CHAT domain-containing protein [Solirubrobacteraceae bacterium]